MRVRVAGQGEGILFAVLSSAAQHTFHSINYKALLVAQAQAHNTNRYTLP